jgi:GTP pyrophosphokinase
MGDKKPEIPINDEERAAIEQAYLDMVSTIKSEMDEDDKKSIRKAYEVALEAHSLQRRKSGEPYIFHPITVARICAEEIGLGPTAIVSALLHDVVEDTDITLEDVKNSFGERVAKMVDGLTKLDSAYNASSPQAENFKKVLSTLVEDVRVVLIKMADRLHNMRTLGSMPPHKQLKIAAETSYVYAPLAHRLGLYAFKTEFLDLCMKITDPEDYHNIAKQLAVTKRAREEYIDGFIDPLKSHLDLLQVPYRIFGRAKSIYSIWNKLKTKGVPFEEIYDLFAVRIILDLPSEKEKALCWGVYSIVTDVHTPIPQRLKDWITTPKSNGYESLHTTVIGPKGRFVEVQIRSERMDEIAERGFAAHWKYKGVAGGSSQDVYEQWLDSVREILEDPNSDAVEFLGDFKANNLFHEEVYVYTPNGDMKILPKGASALDFAFSIHTDVGYHCSAIKVGRKLVPMGYKLKNGDQLEIITNKNQRPSEDWLKMVVTGKARSKIRSAMKEERRKKGEFGKEALERKFRHLKVDFDEAVETIVAHFKYESQVDLYYEIAMNHFSITEISKTFHPEHGKLVLNKTEYEEHHHTDVVEEERVIKRPRKDSFKPRLLINGEDASRFDFTFATCCNPVQGDEIFAFLTSTAGLKIHRTNCPNATNMMAHYGYRVMKAEWILTQQSQFVANLEVTGVDNGPGVIEQLSHELSSLLGLDIRSFSIAGDEGYYEGTIGVLVSNKDQLNLAMRVLQNLDIVSTVKRVV